MLPARQISCLARTRWAPFVFGFGESFFYNGCAYYTREVDSVDVEGKRDIDENPPVASRVQIMLAYSK